MKLKQGSSSFGQTKQRVGSTISILRADEYRGLRIKKDSEVSQVFSKDFLK